MDDDILIKLFLEHGPSQKWEDFHLGPYTGIQAVRYFFNIKFGKTENIFILKEKRKENPATSEVIDNLKSFKYDGESLENIINGVFNNVSDKDKLYQKIISIAYKHRILTTDFKYTLPLHEHSDSDISPFSLAKIAQLFQSKNNSDSSSDASFKINTVPRHRKDFETLLSEQKTYTIDEIITGLINFNYI